MGNAALKQGMMVAYVLKQGDGSRESRWGEKRPAMVVSTNGHETLHESACANLCVFIDGTNDMDKPKGKEDEPAQMVLWATSQRYLRHDEEQAVFG